MEELLKKWTPKKISSVSGMELLGIIFKTGFFADKEEGIRSIEEIIVEIFQSLCYQRTLCNQRNDSQFI